MDSYSIWGGGAFPAHNMLMKLSTLCTLFPSTVEKSSPLGEYTAVCFFNFVFIDKQAVPSLLFFIKLL